MAGPDRSIGVDRLRAFSDAVFAIAITLLALDIRVPEGLPDAAFIDALRAVLRDIGAYLISFAVIGSLWLNYHRLFMMIARLDPVLLHLNLALLAVIAALPFPTQLISDYGHVPIATASYAGSLATTGALLAAMTLRLRLGANLRHPVLTPGWFRRSILGSSSVAVVFGVSIPIAFVSTTAAQLSWLALIPAQRWLR